MENSLGDTLKQCEQGFLSAFWESPLSLARPRTSEVATLIGQQFRANDHSIFITYLMKPATGLSLEPRQISGRPGPQ